MVYFESFPKTFRIFADAIRGHSVPGMLLHELTPLFRPVIFKFNNDCNDR